MSHLLLKAAFLMAALACMSFVVLHFELSRRQEQAAAEGGVPASASAEGEKLASLLRPAAGDPALSTTPPPLAEQRYADPTPSILQQGISNSAVTHTNSLLSSAVAALKQHPLFNLDQSVKLPLEDVLQRISDDAACRANNTPIFITMANVKSHLYWQLIENFMYTMTKYGIASCALMICVSDARCLELCSQSNFPCYDYQYRESFPDRDMSKISPMEQIATLKLFHFPKALLKGVDVFVVDLDVGFLDDPMKFITSATNFYGHGGNTNNSSTFSGSGDDFSRLSALPDVFVQRDTTFIMNRTVEGWRTWWTEPMPNIGLMLVRGNKKTAKMFEQAWRMYLSISKDIKMNPGKDQNKVVQAMIAARWSVGLNWKYFPGSSAVLVDKIYKFENKSIELGGEHTSRMLRKKGAIAVHVTCYEQLSKLAGLKAANAFWNPAYYSSSKRTLSKQLLFSSRAELQSELRSLAYLARATGRSLVVPNLLGPLRYAREGLVDEVRGRALWPGFRVCHVREQRDIGVEVVEPAFYWRARQAGGRVPPARVLLLPRHGTLREVEAALLAEGVEGSLRVVLGTSNYSQKGVLIGDSEETRRLLGWSADYSGYAYGTYERELESYYELPALLRRGGRWDVAAGEAQQESAQLVVDSVRPCASIFERQRGNRSCFDKCK